MGKGSAARGVRLFGGLLFARFRAPFGYGSFRCRADSQAVGRVTPAACSSTILYALSAMTRVCFKAKAKFKRCAPCLYSSHYYKGRLGGVSRKRFSFTHFVRFAYCSNAPCEKYLSDFSFALPCSFWVWLPSLSGRLAVDTKTCEAALLYALSAMTRVCFKARAHRVPFGYSSLALMKNSCLISALRFSARFGYGSFRCLADSQ